MKSQIVIIFVIIIFLSAGKAQQKNSIEGAWDMLSQKVFWGDTTYSMEKDEANHQLKMMCDNHFTFVGQFVSNNDTSNMYGGGTYSLNNNVYTENCDYHAAKWLVGTSRSYEISVHSDTLVLKGPIGGGNHNGIKWSLIETYIRVH